MSRRSFSSGFTLLEVGVALAIVGLGVVLCLQIFSGGLKLQERASRDTRAVLYARAVMDALLAEREIYNHSEQRDVTAEGYRATIVVREAGPEDGADFGPDFEPSTDFGLRVLEVRVEWQDATGIKAYDLRSMRMAPEEF